MRPRERRESGEQDLFRSRHRWGTCSEHSQIHLTVDLSWIAGIARIIQGWSAR
jgi:hypothetical protein